MWFYIGINGGVSFVNTKFTETKSPSLEGTIAAKTLSSGRLSYISIKEESISSKVVPVFAHVGVRYPLTKNIFIQANPFLGMNFRTGEQVKYAYFGGCELILGMNVSQKMDIGFVTGFDISRYQILKMNGTYDLKDNGVDKFPIKITKDEAGALIFGSKDGHVGFIPSAIVGGYISYAMSDTISVTLKGHVLLNRITNTKETKEYEITECDLEGLNIFKPDLQPQFKNTNYRITLGFEWRMN